MHPRLNSYLLKLTIYQPSSHHEMKLTSMTTIPAGTTTESSLLLPSPNTPQCPSNLSSRNNIQLKTKHIDPLFHLKAPLSASFGINLTSIRTIPAPSFLPPLSPINSPLPRIFKSSKSPLIQIATQWNHGNYPPRSLHQIPQMSHRPTHHILGTPKHRNPRLSDAPLLEKKGKLCPSYPEMES
ncbi:uncharacterized protein LY89DRAFT_126299 [Mollisia scopiformis]|uniref:Uncharacterized protein n=1 Tax=Mollisia scopiformis TaxID=149040 RepID=A0A194X581_MOLSC|nr:uncharacterized protein LY89DRAFT_126299 [Mollisia scopiformis]KUJ14962.1 hypothetical protein LY89DRAFT_126299 [Mollisia scopiformis]